MDEQAASNGSPEGHPPPATSPLTRTELEERVGQAIGPKMEFWLHGEELWHREDGLWRMYAPPAEDFRPSGN